VGSPLKILLTRPTEFQESIPWPTVKKSLNTTRTPGTWDETVGTGMVGAPACGDVMKLQIKVNPQTGLIEDAKFKTYGCGSAIASSSLVTEWIKGKSLDEALTIKNTQIAEELALPPVKIHCSILAEDAIKAAVNDYKAKTLQAA
jgi:nitrogen fixation protein NifU and related proteins